MIIGISGKSGCGKDTLANIFMGMYPEMNFQQMAFADKVKELAGALLSVETKQFENREYKESWNEELSISVRGILQVIGDGLREKIHPDVWLIALQKRIDPNANVLISDVRYFNEAQFIKKMGGMVISIDRYATPEEWAKICQIPIQYQFEEPTSAISKEAFIEWLKRYNGRGEFTDALERLSHSTENGMVGFDDYDFNLENRSIQEFHQEAVMVGRTFDK
jgi:ABC-type dipeptide/oligopeptide/nickel transport system ATPase component